MRSRNLFLLVYLVWSCCGTSSAQRNVTCAPGEMCGQVPDSTSRFLQCVGLPPTDTGKDHVRRTKEILEATMDLYTFMKSSITGVPFLSLQGELHLNPRQDPHQNEALVQMWSEIKLKPLLKSINKHFLSCLSTRNFSCSTYQIVVNELSQHFSEMNEVRRNWIYAFFMYPFLSGDRVDGCMKQEESSEDWLIKNFGAFSVMARLQDFSTLNMMFSGLEVLHLLSPAQKAELLLRPEVASLDNGTLTLIFHNLLTGGPGPHSTSSPGIGHNMTTSLYPVTHDPQTTYSPYQPPSTHHPHPYDPYLPTSPHNNLREVVNGFMTAFSHIGSFVHEFVSFTNERDVSKIRSTTLAQFLLNWTLAEVADMYRPSTTVPDGPKFDVTNVEDWYQHVVIPLLLKFLPDGANLMHRNITLAFHQVFYLDHDMDHNMDNETSEIMDVCSITLDKAPCGLTDTVINVAHVLHCAADTNLTMSEETIMRLVVELTARLNSLVKELSMANFTELAFDIREIFNEEEPPSLTEDHLNDPDFIKLWFKIKLMPLLPKVPVDILSCLSTKNFSCPVYQTIVAELDMNSLDAHQMYSRNIYTHFIYPFLFHHNSSDPQCMSSANNSAEWLTKNFGSFSRFASIVDFYKLNQNFSGLEVLHLLTPNQTAEMLLLNLTTPPEKDKVFDFLLSSPEEEKLVKVLRSLVLLAQQVNPPCSIYRHIFERLYKAIPSVPPYVESVVWAGIDELMSITPEECLPDNITCPETHYNASRVCSGVDSSDLQAHLSASMEVSCNFTLETYACAQLKNFTANQLVSLLKCNLPGNSSHSKVLWKMLLTKLSSVLDPGLDILANMSNTTVVPSAMDVLDVIGEIRLSFLTDEQLMNSSVLTKWFSERLSGFLPFASVRFLTCLSRRNLSCHSYQQILQVFIHHFHRMTLKQQNVVLNDFILRFLRSHSGPGCVSISNSSADWLLKNLGPFSGLLSVKELFVLNQNFNPIKVLHLLTPKQTAELLILDHPNLSDKDVIINTIFDHLLEPPNVTEFTKFLSNLDMVLQMANLSCSSYKTLFVRMDLALAIDDVELQRQIMYSKMILSGYIPPGCIIYSTECNVTMTNETEICAGVNSTMLQLHIDRGQMNGTFCNYPIEEFACASLSALTAEDLASILACNRSLNSSTSRPIWKLLLTKVSDVLNEALDVLSNKTLDLSNPTVSVILDSIREVRLDTFGNLNNPAIIQLWFKQRLRPFLPAVSPDFLLCLTTKGLNCTTYQYIVKILSHLKVNMSISTQMSVYTHFIRVFLTRENTTDPSCILNTNNSGDWLQKNLGAFSFIPSFNQLQMLHSNFSGMEALSELTATQITNMAATPGQLTSGGQVITVMRHIPNKQLAAFFDKFSPAIMSHQNMFSSAVRSAMLQVVFERANLSDPSVGDSVVMVWLHNRLRPLLFNLSTNHVAPFFRILAGRNCSIQQQGVQDLNWTISTLSEDVNKEVHNHIIQALKGPTPLQCYVDNNSFYIFLENTFMGFQFPKLTAFLSLMPNNRLRQLVNSMPPSDLGDFLRRPDIVDNDAELCVIYNNYIRTPTFLETESLPEVLRRPTLPCVWPMALSSSNKTEVNKWFDQRLHNYLGFLTKSLISPRVTQNTSCLAFRKLVSVLGEYNYTAADFRRKDVFNMIRSYLTSDNVTIPRCYNASDPELNSTAWFAEYIARFLSFLTLDVFNAFGSVQFIQVFTVNLVNIALLNQTTLPINLTDYYTELVYLQNSNFNPILLPLVYRCVAPGLAFMQLTAAESMIVMYNLTSVCSNINPEVSAALAGNLGNSIDATSIAVLGNQSTGLSIGQIMMIKPQDLFNALSTLSNVMGWNLGQANAIIQLLMSMMEINSASVLFQLGSLVIGVPATTFSRVNNSQLLTASKNPTFVSQILTAPQVVQQAFVSQIITVNSNSDSIIENIPDEMATEIPRVLLLSLSNNRIVFEKLNKKKWKQQQVELFFSQIAAESATTQLGSANNLSSSVLQGFTCVGVRTIGRVQIKKLIGACRRKGRNKVVLMETQLTCMYSYIKNDSNVTSFHLYPPDLLLYYDYTLVPRSSCRAYFEELADADFSIFSAALSYKRTALFTNARDCLGITTTNLTEDNISVLGNMCCTLDGSYIENSHSSVLEKLKSCSDLTKGQAAAAESLLLSGSTQYGVPSTWSEQTLKDLDMLPLYLTSTFYDNFNKKTKRKFLKYFLKVLANNGVSRKKKKKLKTEIRKSIKNKTKRSTVNECTVRNITQVDIHDETFPFDFDDTNQFNYCLSATTVKDNLASIAEKVDDEEYLRVILSKLKEAYQSSISESQVNLLGPVSRVATVSDIAMWNITKIDTLSALMDTSNGEWDPSLARAIILKYLNWTDNKLGSAELNSIGDNLCALDTSVLKNISPQSLKDANALNVTNCTKEQKKQIFAIAKQAFASSGTRSTTVSAASYQLKRPYLAGADLANIRSLVSSNVNMDMATFVSLDEEVVLNLTVSEVSGLLGANVAELKSYENQSLVRSWIIQQPQSELESLGLGLTGGKADPTNTTNTNTTNTTNTNTNSNTTTSTASPSVVTATAGSTNTTGSYGGRIQADPGFSFVLVLLTFFVMSQHAYFA